MKIKKYMQQLFSWENYRSILPVKLDSFLGKAYTTCDTLPLYNFIEIVVAGNYKSLIIWGWVRNLEVTWEKIHEEYTSLTKDNSFSASFRLVKEIYILNNKLNIIEPVVKHLAIRYVPELFQQLRNMGFNYAYKQNDYHKDLQKVMVQRKGLILRLKQAKKELDALSNNKALTKQDYYDTLSSLGKFKGADINPKNYTVMQFISDINLYKKSNA